MIHAFHSAVVEVVDFDQAVADYTRLLGQAPSRLEVWAEAGASAFFMLANMRLEIRSQRAGSPEDAAPASQGVVGIRFCADLQGGDPTQIGALGLLDDEGGVQRRVSLDQKSTRRFRQTRIDPVSSRGIAIELISNEEIDSALPTTGDPGPRSRSPSACIDGLDHVVILSPAVESTRAVYAQEGLDLRLALDRTFEARGVRLLFFRVGGVTIEIGSRTGQPPRPDLDDQFGGLAWRVPDIEATVHRLAEAGVDVSEIRKGNKPGTRVCTVRSGTHGVPTLLIEPVPEPAPERD